VTAQHLPAKGWLRRHLLGTSRVCRTYEGLGADPADGVIVAYEPGNSGPGWDVWAHRDHVGDAELVPSRSGQVLR